MNKQARYSPEVRERAARMVLTSKHGYNGNLSPIEYERRHNEKLNGV